MTARNVSLSSILCWIVPLVLATPRSQGQDLEPVLVRDINTTPFDAGCAPRFLLPVGPLLYFAGSDETGQELWVSDGTPEGTERLADLAPYGESRPRHLTRVGDTVFFAAADVDGHELWMSDGTAAGTVRVRDIHPGVNPVGNSFPSELFDFGGVLVFGANDGEHGHELWRSDGTEAGTFMLKDIVDGSSNPTGFTVVNGVLYFVAGAHGDREVWRSDGTEAGTVRLAEVYPGGNAFPVSLTELDGTLFFSATDGTGHELWQSDGTEAGTVKIDLEPGGGSFPNYLTAIGGELYFTASIDLPNRLWRYDPATGTATQVADVPVGGTASPLTAVGGVLFFNSAEGNGQEELWKFDPSTGIAELVMVIHPIGTSFSGRLVPVGGLLFFAANDGTTGIELWKHDLTTGVTEQVIDLVPGALSSHPRNLTEFAGELFFTDLVQEQLWRTDGTEPGTIPLGPIRETTLPAVPFGGVVLGSNLYFTANDEGQLDENDQDPNRELWKTDGSEAGTVKVAEINADGSSHPVGLVPIAGRLYFSADDGITGRQLWEHDPDLGTTAPVTPAWLQVGDELLPVGERLFFSADDGVTGNELWSHDMASDSTELVADVNPTGHSGASKLTLVGDSIFFRANDGSTGTELWKHEPASGLTELVADLNPVGAGSFPQDLVDVQGTLFFVANVDFANSLWRSDGTAAGTTLVDINPGGNASPNNLTMVDGVLYFGADDGVTGNEPWRHDPATGVTELIADLNPDDRSFPSQFTGFGGAVFFAATGEEGRGLWKFDPATDMVELIADHDPLYDQNPGGDELLSVGGALYFSAVADAVQGLPDLWVSDGTPEGTGRVPVDPHGPAIPLGLTNFNGSLFFTARRPDVGFELFKLSAPGSGDGEPPTVDDLAAVPNPVAVGQALLVTAAGDDSTTGGSVIVSASLSIDGGPPLAMDPVDGDFDSAREEVLAVLEFSAVAVHEICVSVTDASGNTSASQCLLVAVYDPSGGFITGGGFLPSPPGACALDADCAAATGTVNFGFVCKYHKKDSTPRGNTQINFSEGGLNFHSESYDWLFIEDGHAVFQGAGHVNGEGGYGFLVNVIDADQDASTEVDLIRIKIWDLAGSNAVIYDTEQGLGDLADPSTPLAGGQIVIHGSK